MLQLLLPIGLIIIGVIFLINININSIDAIDTYSRGIATLFAFHLENKGIGDDVKITVEGENGQALQWRTTLFISHNIERYDDYGMFHKGERVTACIINYDENNYSDCDTATVDKFGNADFDLKVAPY